MVDVFYKFISLLFKHLKSSFPQKKRLLESKFFLLEVMLYIPFYETYISRCLIGLGSTPNRQAFVVITNEIQNLLVL